ncbi:MAG: pimeloyl-ACP methyl ester carboxylesterase [Psychroserpens sp.]|jgi:pimeloyl-ACP methyl ester carboxylesterase|uniref:alpha/beta fold hydrolase n=1 Tax=Psychroserpens sp. TaxID=2020870 RepID=UPI0039E33C22
MKLQYKGIPVFYEDEGRGSPIILLHGFLENSTMWKEIKPVLLKDNRVICIDLLGHGQTQCLGYVHTMSDMAEAVLAVLNYLELETYTLIGHSMGGYVALALADKNPIKIKGLCLMNSTFYADDDDLKALRKKANRMVQTHYESMVRMSVANLFSSESSVTHKKEIDKVIEQALETSPQGYIAGQEGMLLREDKFEFFKNLDAEKLIVIGRKDPVVKVDLLISDVKGTTIQYQELSDGHMSHIENKTELSYILIRFVEFIHS